GHTSLEWPALERMAEDQLSSAAGCLVFNDFPGLLNPLSREVDRGRKLEEAWVRLGRISPKFSPLERALKCYAADERDGWKPSLVFTPMLVEDGRRLLISNLDLSFVSRNYGRILMERIARRLDVSYIKDLMPGQEPDDEDLFSLSAVEFYRLFPQ